jgi:hypothetical protein
LTVHRFSKPRPGRAFNAALPEPLHRLLKTIAVEQSKKVGGQHNMNRLIVELLFDALKIRLSDSEQAAVKDFISKL